MEKYQLIFILLSLILIPQLVYYIIKDKNTVNACWSATILGLFLLGVFVVIIEALAIVFNFYQQLNDFIAHIHSAWIIDYILLCNVVLLTLPTIRFLLIYVKYKIQLIKYNRRNN